MVRRSIVRLVDALMIWSMPVVLRNLNRVVQIQAGHTACLKQGFRLLKYDPNPGLTEFREILVELTRLLKPSVYVEVGVSAGYVFNAIVPFVPQAVAVDINPMPLIPDRPNVKKYVMPSEEFAQKWSGEIDFLFIDADHRKEMVLKDFDLLAPFVKEGQGLIFLHDTHPVSPDLLSDDRCSNAWEAAWEIRTHSRYKDFEIVTIPGPRAGLSILRKATKQLAWM